MKKLVCIVISIVMMLSLCAPASAIDIAEAERMRALETIAYLDLDEVDESMKAKVLSAREEIIFSESWVVDGKAEIIDQDGNVVRELPKFSELFPEDWAVPVLDAAPVVIAPQHITSLERNATFALLYRNSVLLRVPSATVNTTPFTYKNTYYTSSTTGNELIYRRMEIEVIYSNDSGNGTYNLGATNAVTGASQLFAEYIPNGQWCSYTPTSQITLAIRASTYDPNYATYWSMEIRGFY